MPDDASRTSQAPWVGLLQLAFIGLAALLVFQFVSVAREGELRRRCTSLCLLRPNYAGADRRAPAFTLKDMNGKDVSLDAYRGKVVVLNFWTKTCRPCLEEMPALAELSKILKARPDVALLTVTVDEGPAEVRDVLAAVLGEEPPFPILFDSESKVVKEKYGTHLFPETWIVDKDGIIRARFDRALDWGSGVVLELIDHLRGGGYCPVQVRDGQFSGEAKALCEGTRAL